jgi:hypothetical protein
MRASDVGLGWVAWPSVLRSRLPRLCRLCVPQLQCVLPTQDHDRGSEVRASKHQMGQVLCIVAFYHLGILTLQSEDALVQMAPREDWRSHLFLRLLTIGDGAMLPSVHYNGSKQSRRLSCIQHPVFQR